MSIPKKPRPVGSTEPPVRRYNFRPLSPIEPGPNQLMPRGGRRQGNNFEGYIPETHHSQYYPARNQGFWELAGNTLGQFANEVVLGAAEGAGYLIDVTDWLKPWRNQEAELGNWFSDWARETKESINQDILPIYDHRNNEGFQPWQPRWWAKNGATIGSFLSILIPMTGAMKALSAVGKGASWAARGTKLASKAADFGRYTGLTSRASQYVGQGLAAGAFSRHMEGMMEATGLYQEMLQNGASPEEAARAASQNYRTNSVLFIVDAVQMGALFSKGASRALQKIISRRGKAQNAIAEALFQAPGEGFEEAYQHISQQEAKARAAGEGSGGPFSLFGENFMDRWDNYMRDEELWTATLLGAFGGLATPMAMDGINRGIDLLKGNKNPIAKKQQELDELRQQLSDKLTASQAEYLQDRDFLSTAMYFASQGRMHDMEGFLDTYMSEWKENPETELQYERAQKFKEMIPEFEKIFNSVYNKSGYSRGGKWEHISDSVGALRNRSIIDQFELKQLKKAYDLSTDEIGGVIDGIEELDPKHRTAYELYQQKLVADLRGDEKTSKALEEQLNTELKNLEEAGTPINPEETLLTSQDELVQSIYSYRQQAEQRVEEIRESIRNMETQEGQLKILREIDKYEGEKLARHEEFLSYTLGDGVVIGDETNEWHVKQEGERFIVHKPGNPDVPGAAATPVSERESEDFYKNGTITEPRMAAIANKIRHEGVGALDRHEKAMYLGQQTAIDTLVNQNKVDNDGQGFTRVELQQWMLNNKFDILDNRNLMIEQEDAWIADQRSQITKQLDVAQNELAGARDARHALQSKMNRVEGRWGREAPSWIRDKRQLDKLDEEIKSLEKEIAELEEEYDKVEESDLLYYRRRVPETPAEEEVVPIFGSEAEKGSGSVPPKPEAGDDSGDGTDGPPPPDNEQTGSWTGRPANLYFHTLAGQEVTDGKANPIASQRRYFKWVREHKISGKNYAGQVFPVVNEDGSKNENWDRFLSKAEKDLYSTWDIEAQKEIMIVAVVNNNGQPIGADGNVISWDSALADGLFTTMRSTSPSAAKNGIDSSDSSKVKKELDAYREARNAMRASAWAGNNVFIKFVGKTPGWRTIRDQPVPIADAAKNRNGIKLYVTRHSEVRGDGLMLKNIHFGSPILWDENRGQVIVGTPRMVGESEQDVNTLLRLFDEARAAEKGLDDLHQQSTVPYRTLIRSYIYYGAPSNPPGRNTGGDIYHADSTYKTVTLRDFAGESMASFSLDDLLTARREEFTEWLRNRRRMVDDKRLWHEGISNKKLSIITSPKNGWQKWYYDGTQWQSKKWTNYTEMMLDRDEAIIVTHAPPYVDETPQEVNGNLIYNYREWRAGSVNRATSFPIDQKPLLKKSPRTRTLTGKGAEAHGRIEEVIPGRPKEPKPEKPDIPEDELRRAKEDIKKAKAEMMGAQSEIAKARKEMRDSNPKRKKKSRPSDKSGGPVIITDVQDAPKPPPPGIEERGITNPSKDQKDASDVPTDDTGVNKNSETGAKRPRRRGGGTIKGKNRDVAPYIGSDYVQEDLVAAEKWFKERFPQVDFRIVHHLVKSGAWGRFTEAGQVLIDEAAAAGTTYHEAFHVTSGLFLSANQRDALYNEYRDKFKQQGMTDAQVEEELAELFRTYVQTGTLPEELTQARSWFQELLRYLRQLLGRPDIIETFDRINNGFYAKMTPDYSNLWQSWDREIDAKFSLDGKTSEFTRMAVAGIHIDFMRELRDKGLTYQFLDGSVDPNKLRDVYLNVREMILANKGEFAEQLVELQGQRDAALDESTRMELNAKIEDLVYLYDNFFNADRGPSVIELHHRHLAQMGIKISGELNLEEEDINEDETPADPDNDWAGLHIENSQFSSASSNVRFLLSGLMEYEFDPSSRSDIPKLNRLGFYEPMKFGKAFALLATKLAGTTTIQQQVERIQELIPLYPDMAQVLEDFALSNTEGRQGSGFVLRMEFFQAFAKNKNNYTKDIVRGNSAVQRTMTGSTNKKRQLLKKWETAYNPKGLPAFVRENFRVSGKSVRSFNEAIEVATAIGIELEGAATTVRPHEQATIIRRMDFIATNILRNKNPYALKEDSEQTENGSDLRAIADIEIEHSPDITENSHIGLKNTTIYDNVQYSWWSYMGARLNDIVRTGVESGLEEHQIRQQIINEFPHLDSPYARNSELLSRVISHRGEETSPFTQSVEEGITDYSGRVKSEYSKLNSTDKFIKEMIDLTKGVYHMLRPNDNSLERTYTLGVNLATNRGEHYFKLSDVTDDINKNPVLDNVIRGYLEDELRILNAVRVSDPERFRNWKRFTENMTNDENDLKSGILMPLLRNVSKKTRRRILTTINAKRDIDGVIDRFLKSKEGQEAITRVRGAIFHTANRRLLPKLQEVGFFKDGYMIHDFEEVAKESGTIRGVTYNTGRQKIAQFLAINHMINVIEQTKIFSGHPAQFKDVDDMIKRMSGAVGPKTLAAVDPVTNAFLKERFGIENAERPYLRIATVKDPVSSSRYDYLDILTKRFGKEAAETKAALYRLIEEADAHAVMTLDAYRHFNLRNGNWDHRREMSYIWQKEGGWKGKKVVVPNSNPFVEIRGKEVTRDMVERNEYLLVSQKPQGFGPLADTGMMAMYKLAWTPLLPEMIAGTEMEKLNEKMESDGTDVVVMESGHKVGVRTNAKNEVQPLYDTEGNISSTPFINQEFGMQYMGIQVANTPTAKDKTTNGSQLQRQIEAGLMHMGMPADWIMSKIDPKREKAKKPKFEESRQEDFVAALEPILIRKEIPKDIEVPMTRLKDGKPVTEQVKGKRFYKDQITFANKLNSFRLSLQGGTSIEMALITSGMNQEEQEMVRYHAGDTDTVFDLVKRLEDITIDNIQGLRTLMELPQAEPVTVGTEQQQVIYDDQFDLRQLTVDKESELLAEWRGMTEAQRRSASPVYNTMKKLRKAQQDAIDYSFAMLESRLGLKLNPETKEYERDPAKMAHAKAFLLDEMRKRDLPINMLEAIRWFDDGTDVIINTNQMQSILMSIATKQVLNRKKSGSGYAMVPSTFKGTKPRTAAYVDPQKGTVWSADDLEFYREENGEIKGFEVYLPHKYKELWGQDVTVGDIPAELLEMIGFRIPTQGLSSIDFFKVKGFLPAALGDSIMVPPEIVAKTGADFDWDKLFVHMRNYELVDGKPQVVKRKSDVWNARKKEFALEFEPVEYREIMDTYRKKVSDLLFGADLSGAEWERTIRPLLRVKNLPGNVYRMIREIEQEIDFSDGVEGTTMSEADIIRRMTKVQEELKALESQKEYALNDLYGRLEDVFNTLSPDQQQGLKYLDNQVIDRQMDLLKMPNRMAELIAPVTVDPTSSVFAGLAKRFQEERNAWLEKHGRPTQGAQSFSKLLDPIQMGQVGHNLVQGKSNIGVPALAATSHINSTQAGLATRMDTETQVVSLDIPHNRNEDGDVLLGRQVTQDGQYFISDLVNELVSAYADIGANPFIITINGGESANIYAVMTKMGIAPMMQVALMNQPVIAKYLHKLELQNSKYLKIKRSDIRADSKQTVKDNMFAELAQKIGKDKVDSAEFREISTKKIKDVTTMWNHSLIPYDPADSTLEDNWDNVLQYVALRVYTHLETAAERDRQVIQGTTHNTKFTGRDNLVAISRLRYTQRVMDGTPWEALFENDSFLEIARKGVERASEMMMPFSFITSDPAAYMAFSYMVDELMDYRPFMSEEEKHRFLQTYSSEFLTHLYHRATDLPSVLETAQDPIMSYKRENGVYVENQNTIPKRILKYKRMMAKPGVPPGPNQVPYNMFVDHLVVTLKNQTPFAKDRPHVDENGDPILDKNGKPMVRRQVKYTDNMSLQPGKKMDSATLDAYVEEYRDLITRFPSFAEPLFNFMMLQNGVLAAPNNFMNVIPHEEYAKRMRGAIETMRSENSDQANIYWEGFGKSELFINVKRDPMFDWHNKDVPADEQFLATKQYVHSPDPRKRKMRYRVKGRLLGTEMLPYEDQSNFASLHVHKGEDLSRYDTRVEKEEVTGKESTPEVSPTNEVDEQIRDKTCEIPF